MLACSRLQSVCSPAKRSVLKSAFSFTQPSRALSVLCAAGGSLQAGAVKGDPGSIAAEAKAKQRPTVGPRQPRRRSVGPARSRDARNVAVLGKARGKNGKVQKLIMISTAAIMNEKGQVLMTEHISKKHGSVPRWGFPGGKVDIGEVPQEALLRELSEELALQVDSEDLWSLSFCTFRLNHDTSGIVLLYGLTNYSLVGSIVMAESGKRVKSNGLTFYVRDQGSGTPVVLLHGFPCDGDMWSLQVEALSAAGYRTICPDLRGAGESDRPKETSGYELTNLVTDVIGILDELKVDKAHIVGHDWGAGLAWAVAGQHKERTLSLTAISVGHPKCFFAGEKGLEQKRASWYGEQAAAITSGLNWYRANVKPESFLAERLADGAPNIGVNTLAIAATGDRYLIADQVRNSGQYVDEPATFRFELVDCPNHWLNWEIPDKLNSLILEHIKQNDS
ncbi:hypothetical protein WJX73_006055 [Symbiochloris irregularis]|uniref:Nudix hydrolase domain-containing protein n=1 Tax=Symbiochloris irregularis TaxID=706552 RepID=A0AAW1P6B7_9CHLO